MARYGIDYYGRAFYGNTVLSSYDSSPFTATPIDYAKIYLSWTTPAGYWTGIRLLRSMSGFPETADDGVILLDSVRGSTGDATATSKYDPSSPEIPLLPHLNHTTNPQDVRIIKSWAGGANSFSVTLNDISYLASGVSINIYGGTPVDGSWVISSISPDLSNTVIISTSLNQFLGQSGPGNQTLQISNVSFTSTTATYTYTSTSKIINIGDSVTVSSVDPVGYNGTFTVTDVGTISVGSSYSFTVLNSTASTINNSTGTLTIQQPAFAYVNELAQGNFYYYSLFLKILTNTIQVSSAVSNGTSVTYTTSSSHTFAVGNYIGVMNMAASSFNVSGALITATTSNTFTIAYTLASATSTGGIAGINTQWVRAGNTTGISVKDYGSQYKFYDYLPNIYKVSNTELGLDNPENPTLRSFLAIFGFYYDLLKTYAEISGKRYKTDKIAGNLIPAALQQFNFKYEPELGFKRMRSLIANAIHLYQSKGSSLGVTDYIKALTGNAVNISQGKNLFLDSNDSSFENSSTADASPYSRWATTNGTLIGSVAVPITSWSTASTTISLTCTYNSNLSTTFATGSSVYIYGTGGPDGAYTSGVVVSTTTDTLRQVSTMTVTITTSSLSTASGTGGYLYPYPTLPYSETSNPNSEITNGTNGLGILTVTSSSGTVTAICGSGDTVLKTIPVTAGLAYTFSYKVKSLATSKSFTAAINWYDFRGTYISRSTVGTAVSSSTSAWSTVSSVNMTAPSTAYFAAPVIICSSTVTSEIHYIDACQLEQSTTATYFQEARQLQVFVQPNRTNLVSYSNFDYASVGTWSALNANLTIAKVGQSSYLNTNTPSSVFFCKATSTGSSDVTISMASSTSNYIAVSGGNQYTYDVNLVTASDNSPTVGSNAYLQIDWYDSSYVSLSSSHSYSAITPLYPASATNFSLEAVAPTTAAYANLKIVWQAPVGSGYAFLFNSVLFENQPYFIDFFNGDIGYADIGDLAWGGTAGSSQSYYYKNRLATKAILNANLASFLPYGSNFAVYYRPS